MFNTGFCFAWDRFCRNNFKVTWLDWNFRLSQPRSSHSPLPISWERLCAPCKCSFVKGSSRGFEESYFETDDIYWRKPCPLKRFRQCSVRMLYINHTTGEATLHCPCATCSPDWKAAPCLTLNSLFGEDESSPLDENCHDPLIPAQDLTRVGKSCWRLGDLFDRKSVPYSRDLDIDPAIPAQDVGLHIFDDMPGFALAKNHPPITTAQESTLKVLQPPLAERTPLAKQPPVTVQLPPLPTSKYNDLSDVPQGHRPYLKKLLLQLPTSVSIASILSLFVDYTTTSSSHSPHDPQLSLSWSEAMEAFIALIISVLFVFAYECANIYTYIRDLPSPPPFLSKLVGIVLLAVGLRCLSCHFGVV